MAEISNEESAEMGTILVVEDDTGLLLLIGKNLGRLGYATALFSNEEKAMERILFNPPQLLMLDYQLATMTGREFLETLSTKCTLPPFIIMTGHGNETIAVKMMKLGAIDYLIKDHVFLDLLPSVVEQAIGNINTQQKLVVAEREKSALRNSSSSRRRWRQSAPWLAASPMTTTTCSRLSWETLRWRKTMQQPAAHRPRRSVAQKKPLCGQRP